MNTGIAIKAGITGYAPAWEILLEQIGMDWSVITGDELLSPAAYSLLIVNSPLTGSQFERVHQYAHNGGAVLHCLPATQQDLPNAAKITSLRYLPPQSRREYSFSSLFDIYRKTFVFPNDSLTQVQTYGTGILSYLGLDVPGIMNDRRMTRKAFLADHERLPNERVSRSAKNALREFLLSHIEYLHHQRGIPFVHKWYFPNGAQSIFTFRIDSDKGSQEDIEHIYRLCDDYKIPATWFLDVRSHESWLSYFRKFTGQEIGIHCYHHAVHRSTVLNEENFGKAKSLLERQGIRPVGIAAPTGAWNEYIGNAIRNMGMEYSSEFGYDYDNLPTFPLLGKSHSPVVQLPIHPICIGSLLRAGFNAGEMTGYFKRIIDKKILRSEPICFYHHPTHNHTEVFKEVFEYIHSRKIPSVSYADYAGWWKRRAQQRCVYSIDGSILRTKGADDDRVWVRVSRPDAAATVIPVRQDIDLRTVPFEFPGSSGDIDQNASRARKFSARHVLQDIFDWWIKTTE